MSAHYAILLPFFVMTMSAVIWTSSPTFGADFGLVDSAGAAQQSARLYAHGDLNGAVQVLHHAIQTQPHNAQLHFMLANALFRQREWPGAIHHYREAARLRTQHPDTHLGLGFASYQAGRVNDAVAAWRTAMHQSPNDALTHLSLAIGLSARGQLIEARHHIAQALDLDPSWQRRLSIDVRWTQDMMEGIRRLAEQVAQGSATSPTGR